MILVIVESPGKIKKLQGYLGSDYKVSASIGHITELKAGFIPEAPDYNLSFDISKDKKKVVAGLRKLVKKADLVILATDPDREGEAIAWHLKEVLKLKNPQRIAFNEINKKSVLSAVSSPRSIDMNLVEAQKARQSLDRIVGFKISMLLIKAFKDKLSAGRVQSPAVLLVVEREREIVDFKPVKHFIIQAFFINDKIKWTAKLKNKGLLTDESLAQAIADETSFKIVDVIKKESVTKAPPPLNTSALQQKGAAALKVSPDKIMNLAQKLYEAGLITYHRTDSVNLSDSANEEIKTMLIETGFKDYVDDSINKFKSKGGAQEAHEAVRPSNFNNPKPDGLSEQSLTLYELIYKRAVAQRMKPALYDTVKVTLLTEEPISGEKRSFEVSGRTLTFAGWQKYIKSDNKKDRNTPVLPSLKKGMILVADKVELLAKKTSPPPRYNFSSLVKALESKGIGRPSTYASIIQNINEDKQYIEVVSNVLKPTAKGYKVADSLVNVFQFMDYSYTEKMEKLLDLLASGSDKVSYRQIITIADQRLIKEIEVFEGINPIEHFYCECGSELEQRYSKKSKGHFWICCNCEQILPDKNGKPGQKKEKIVISEGELCPICKKGKAVKKEFSKGKNKGKSYIGCSTWNTTKCNLFVWC